MIKIKCFPPKIRNKTRMSSHSAAIPHHKGDAMEKKKKKK